MIAIRNKDSAYRDSVDAVLQVSLTANMEMYERLREDADMCEALRELFKDDLADAEARGKIEGKAEGKAEGEIIGNVKAYRKIRRTPSEIVMILMEDYHMKRDAAEKAVADILGLQLA